MLALLLLFAAALPSLVETQDAAALAAGGSAEDDASRAVRARNSHWAPQVRAQAGEKADQMSKLGQRYNAPLVESDDGHGQTYGLMFGWDFSQVIFAREETQLALAHAHLARLRREARDRAAQLWLDLHRALALHASLAASPQRIEACAAALALVAQLDSITAGLFRDALAAQEAACAKEENKQ